MRLDIIIILHNKVDLVKTDAAAAQYDQMCRFVSGNVAHDAPGMACEYMVHHILDNLRYFISVPSFIVMYLFDMST